MINHPNRSKSEIVIDIEIARKVLAVVDAGLVNGVGNPVPGQMCVEAAVCYALGLPHGDDPKCVAPSLRSLKIRLNDSRWSSSESRAKGLRRLALAQLGSKGHLDEREFATRCAVLATKVSVPAALRSAASIHKDPEHVKALRDAANRCEVEGSRQSAIDARAVAEAARKNASAAADADAAYASASAAYAAYAAASAAYAASAASAAADDADAAYAASAAADDDARDLSLAGFAEGVVQILIEMKAPGCQWLELTEA